MFGEDGGQVAGIAELREGFEPAGSARADLTGEPLILELAGVSAPGARGQHGITRRRPSACARARSWASRASTATASARSRRSSPASARPTAGDIRLAGEPITRTIASRSASAWACATSRTTASARASWAATR